VSTAVQLAQLSALLVAKRGLVIFPPSADRWKIRSATFQGIANAMAQQWGSLV
jgi:hypothetical protein